MKRQAVLAAVRRLTASGSAKDSVELSARLGLGVRETSALLCALYGRGLINRRPLHARRDKFGRRRMTWGYFAGERRQMAAKAIPRRPQYSTALASVWV